MLALFGDMITSCGWIIPNDDLIIEYDSFVMVAVRAMTCTPEGIQHLMSPRRE
jgi:hypothetical protein